MSFASASGRKTLKLTCGFCAQLAAPDLSGRTGVIAEAAEEEGEHPVALEFVVVGLIGWIGDHPPGGGFIAGNASC